MPQRVRKYWETVWVFSYDLSSNQVLLIANFMSQSSCKDEKNINVGNEMCRSHWHLYFKLWQFFYLMEAVFSFFNETLYYLHYHVEWLSPYCVLRQKLSLVSPRINTFSVQLRCFHSETNILAAYMFLHVFLFDSSLNYFHEFVELGDDMTFVLLSVI